MNPLELVKLTPLMARSSGCPQIIVALIDGPVLLKDSHISRNNENSLNGRLDSSCERAESSACMHGTFVAGILSAKRGSMAPAICPDCTLLVRPIFSEKASVTGQIPIATPNELARAIIEVVDAGARVVNMSIGLVNLSAAREQRLEEALNYAARRRVIVVVAAGNQGTLGSSALTRHPWVIPVTASDLEGRPIPESNLGRSTATRGLAAPGKDITSLGSDGEPRTFQGTSAATPFVTGAIALLWSEFPAASADEVKFALIAVSPSRRKTLVPPLLDAWAAYQVLAMGSKGAYK